VPESFERGALTEAVYYILLSVHEPMHGYAIMQNIDRLTEGRVVLGPGTLYGAINALVQKQWIMAVAGDNDSRKKEYIITDIGHSVIKNEAIRLRELIANYESLQGGETK
jgi:DNA-binding PadR family transcriptional regulator